MYAPGRDGNHAFVAEKKLLDWSIARSASRSATHMSPVRGVLLQFGTVERCYSTLHGVSFARESRK